MWLLLNASSVGALEVEHADASILQQQRDHQLRFGVVHHFDVARIDVHVGDQHGLAVQRGVADQSIPQLDARHRHLVAVTHGHFHLQLARLVVDEEDAESPVIDDALGQVRNARQQFVEIQDCRKLAGDFRQRFERAGVLAIVLDEQRVFDRHGDVRSELAEHRFVLGRELAGGIAQEVQRADHVPLAAQRDHELGVRARNGLDIPGIAVDVIHQDRLAVGNGCSDQAMPHLDAKRARNLVRITDGVRDGQLVPLGVQQVDRKGLKLGQAGDQLRNLLEQFVQIEDRRHLAPEREKRRQLFVRAWRSGGHSALSSLRRGASGPP